MIACTPPRPGLSFRSAPRKRQLKRSTVPVSDGIFTPEIRPDSGLPVSSNSNVGDWRDALPVRARAALECGFLAPPVPGTTPVRS